MGYRRTGDDKNEYGSWLVHWNDPYSGSVIPFNDELDALRYVNEHEGVRATWVPDGLDLQDVLRGSA